MLSSTIWCVTIYVCRYLLNICWKRQFCVDFKIRIENHWKSRRLVSLIRHFICSVISKSAKNKKWSYFVCIVGYKKSTAIEKLVIKWSIRKRTMNVVYNSRNLWNSCCRKKVPNIFQRLNTKSNLNKLFWLISWFQKH